METSWKKLRFVVETALKYVFLLGICLFRILSNSAIIWNLPIHRGRGFQKLQNSLLVNFSPKTWLKSKIIDAIANLTFDLRKNFSSSRQGLDLGIDTKSPSFWTSKWIFTSLIFTEVFNIFTHVSWAPFLSLFFILFFKKNLCCFT